MTAKPFRRWNWCGMTHLPVPTQIQAKFTAEARRAKQLAYDRAYSAARAAARKAALADRSESDEP